MKHEEMSYTTTVKPKPLPNPLANHSANILFRSLVQFPFPFPFMVPPQKDALYFSFFSLPLLFSMVP